MPYDSEIGSIANRRMEAVFLEHTYHWVAMEGVLILVIPFERLHDCVGILSSHFARLGVFRMTDPDSVQYSRCSTCHWSESSSSAMCTGRQPPRRRGFKAYTRFQSDEVILYAYHDPDLRNAHSSFLALPDRPCGKSE